MNGERGGAVDTEALLIGSVILILALVPFFLASRRFEMPTGNEYSDVRFDKSNSAERQQSNLGVSGDYGQGFDAPATPEVAAGTYPNVFGYGPDPGDRQFSQDKENDPIRLMESTRQSVRAHADLNEAYGLCQPVQDLGTHCWLRDSLAEPSEREPGNAEPQQDVKTPFRR